jgi:hypothetical protein
MMFLDVVDAAFAGVESAEVDTEDRRRQVVNRAKGRNRL